jgi:uncharacterized protein YsxB (DUF464 family)
MTKAVFKLKPGGKFDIRIHGHAGDKLVCAQCSILAYTLQQALKAEEHSGAFEFYVQDVNIKMGDVSIRCRAKAQTIREIEAEICVIASGYALLQEEHKEHVSVEFYDNGDKLEKASQ